MHIRFHHILYVLQMAVRDWKNYRAFIRMALFLLTEEKIRLKEYGIYFSQGIPQTLQMWLENYVLAKDPILDLSES
jgi:hypothetical protein